MPNERGPVRVLAVSGSLRRGGSNNAVLDAAALLAPDGVEVALLGRPMDGAAVAADPELAAVVRGAVAALARAGAGAA